VIGPTLLRFRLASEATVVKFEIICGKDQEICWCLVSDTLNKYGRMFGWRNWHEMARTKSTISPLTRPEAGMFWMVPSRTTRHDGGIMARKDARIASDFCNW